MVKGFINLFPHSTEARLALVRETSMLKLTIRYDAQRQILDRVIVLNKQQSERK